MNLTLKNITIVATIIALALILIIVAISKSYSSSEIKSVERKNSDSFDIACAPEKDSKEVVCKGGMLNKVLDSRARNPQFMIFNDPTTNVSFEYPSAVASVGKQLEKNEVTYLVYPLMPGLVHSAFWKGAQIFVEPCEGNCIQNIAQVISKKYGLTSSANIEINSDATYVSGRKWTTATINHPMGSEITVYATTENDKLIVVGDDTEGVSANISKAFRRVIETLKTE